MLCYLLADIIIMFYLTLALSISSTLASSLCLAFLLLMAQLIRLVSCFAEYSCKCKFFKCVYMSKQFIFILQNWNDIWDALTTVHF